MCTYEHIHVYMVYIYICIYKNAGMQAGRSRKSQTDVYVYTCIQIYMYTCIRIHRCNYECRNVSRTQQRVTN